MRLVDGGATTFKKEGNDRTGIKNNSTANNQHTGSARTKHREVHSPIETASSFQRTRGTIVKLDSGNGDDLSEISWIHKAGYSAVSPQRPAYHEIYREAHLKQSRQAYLTKKWQAHQRTASERTQRLEMISSPSIRRMTSVHASAPER